MAVTQKDIAHKLGVSQRLISSALNGQGGVGEEMRRKILEEAESLGYALNRAACALATGRTHQIAVCFQSPASAAALEFTRRLQAVARGGLYDLHLWCHLSPDRSTPTVDGALFFGSVPKNMVTPYPVVEMLTDMRGPHAGEVCRQDVVRIVLEEATRHAMGHLLQQNLRRIAYVALPSMMFPRDPLFRAYSAMMQQAGAPLEKIEVNSADDENLRARAATTLEMYFQANGFPDALFCSSDDIALGAYRALRQSGRHIPEGTAVIGCADLEEAKDHRPSLTSVHMPYAEIGRIAWEMLMARLENPALPPRVETIKAHLVVRESSVRRSEATFAASHQETNLAARRKNHVHAEKDLQPS